MHCMTRLVLGIKRLFYFSFPNPKKWGVKGGKYFGKLWQNAYNRQRTKLVVLANLREGKLATIGVAGGKLERTMFVFRCEGFQTAAKVKRLDQFLLLLLPLFFDYLHFYQIYFLNGIANSL